MIEHAGVVVIGRGDGGELERLQIKSCDLIEALTVNLHLGVGREIVVRCLAHPEVGCATPDRFPGEHHDRAGRNECEGSGCGDFHAPLLRPKYWLVAGTTKRVGEVRTGFVGDTPDVVVACIPCAG